MRRVLALLAVALTACGEGDLRIHDDYQDHDLGVVTEGLTVGAAGGCDTSIVSGLTVQLVAELNCITPSSMVDFSASNISLTSAVQPYLAPAASGALHDAVNAQGGTIGISSAYRSVAQQYLLYKWWQAGQCGIQIAATPGNSNHQSGRAIDVPSYSSWMNALTAHGWAWYGSGDVVHFDFNAAPNLGSASVLAFQRVWNKNNSNQLVEDGAWGPNTEGAMAQSPTTGFTNFGCTPPPPADGTLSGFVYEVNPNDAADQSHRLTGATVDVSGHHLTVDAGGAFSVGLAPATYMLTAHAAGHDDATVSKLVQSAQTTSAALGLKLTGQPDTRPPDLAVVSPLDGAVLAQAEVTLQGTASDDSGPLASVSLSVNGAAPHDVAVSGGGFSVLVRLNPGANVAHLEAADGAGHLSALDVHLTFRSGVGGVVTDENGLPVALAQVALVDEQGHAVASAQTQSDGSYALDFEAVPFAGFLTAQAPGFVDYRSSVTVPADARLSWNFQLAHGTAGPGLRLIYPRDGEQVLTARLYVSGQADGFAPKRVTLNGQSAELLEGGRFTGAVELEPGDNLIEAVADDTWSTRVTVTRLDAREWNASSRVRGGCAAAPGALLLPLVLLGLLRRRRR